MNAQKDLLDKEENEAEISRLRQEIASLRSRQETVKARRQEEIEKMKNSEKNVNVVDKVSQEHQIAKKIDEADEASTSKDMSAVEEPAKKKVKFDNEELTTSRKSEMRRILEKKIAYGNNNTVPSCLQKIADTHFFKFFLPQPKEKTETNNQVVENTAIEEDVRAIEVRAIP